LNDPLPATLRWMARLPEEIRPLRLLQQFPRIGNVLARSWDDEAALQAYLDSLLADRRGGRRGFPPEVHNELLTLREYVAGHYPAEAAREDEKTAGNAVAAEVIDVG
jgi:hypothetical protein